MSNNNLSTFSKLKPLNGRYCEICEKYYIGKWQEHISLYEHRRLYETESWKSSIASLDGVIANGPTLETFLSDVSSTYTQGDTNINNDKSAHGENEHNNIEVRDERSNGESKHGKKVDTNGIWRVIHCKNMVMRLSRTASDK
jgi:hypothetical protein